MEIGRLKLVNFKSYSEIEIHPHPKFNFITGLNGVGKTNLLDAIYISCMTKSAFNSRDEHLVNHDADFYRIELSVDNEKLRHALNIKYPRGGRKTITLNDKAYKKYADHLGKFPVVLIAPGDDQLLFGASAERRKYLDTTLGQVDRNYLDQLVLYNRTLKQRNALLKEVESYESIADMLRVYDEKLDGPAYYVYQKRLELIGILTPIIIRLYEVLGNKDVIPSLEYHSHLNEYPSLAEALRETHRRDIAIGRTSRGIHKDDVKMYINGHRIQDFGSQGQRKSFLLAIKLAQYIFLHTALKNRPVLLLDDIFDKLDKTRVRRLLEILEQEPFGQVFITDTDADRLERIFEEKMTAFRHYFVSNNTASTAYDETKE